MRRVYRLLLPSEQAEAARGCNSLQDHCRGDDTDQLACVLEFGSAIDKEQCSVSDKHQTDRGRNRHEEQHSEETRRHRAEALYAVLESPAHHRKHTAGDRVYDEAYRYQELHGGREEADSDLVAKR